MFESIKKIFSQDDARLHDRIKDLVQRTPLPVFWLFGKTQSGKTSIIKYLTGAEEAEIGKGFKACTRFSQEYRFPTAEAPLLIFLDTRGLEEPGYDAAEDLERFHSQAHVMIVTARALDHALENVVKPLRIIRASQPSRPVVLALTCLHEGYPQQQHPDEYPFLPGGDVQEGLASTVPEDLMRSIAAQRRRFEGLFDAVVPLDLTPVVEGFHNPVYGGPRLKEVLIESLPAAYRETLLKLEEATHSLQGHYERQALPYILGFSSLAATAGAIPIPWLDLFILPGIQARMIYYIARLYGQPLSGQRFLEFASTLGLGMLVRQGVRELTKFIPFVGSIAGAALAGSATFALGKAFCFYYGAVHKGHIPKAEDLKRYYHEQLALAEALWTEKNDGENRMPMQRWRLFVLAGLVATPVLILLGFGAYHLWWTGLGIWLWWPLSGFLVAAYFLAWRWQQKKQLLLPEPPPPLHWTDRDLQAWLLVEARAKRLKELHPDQLTSLPKYMETAQELALELARFYHPRATDPVGAPTIPEILTVVELASHDLAEMVDLYLPGGHLLTVNDMRRVKKMADWYPTFSNISWIISSIFNPVNTAARFLAVRGGMSLPWQLLQENILLWFFTAYLNRLGSYLIELNSGRLRVGASRYLELQKGAAQSGEAVRKITLVVIGRTKAGKSSLINALLGEQRAITDVIPATAEIARYTLHPPGISTQLDFLDTVGYGNEGPREDQRRATEDAARHADAILLVLHAHDPARQADVNMMKSLVRYFAGHPELRVPPVLAVLTHIDLLSPSMEWQPPYDWQNPQRTKEKQIAEAMAAAIEPFDTMLRGAIPVCASPGKVYGVNEWLLPALVGLLDQAHAVAFLHCLKAEADNAKIQKVFQQLLSVGKGIASMLVPRKRS